jgi:hypothetical protein
MTQDEQRYDKQQRAKIFHVYGPQLVGCFLGECKMILPADAELVDIRDLGMEYGRPGVGVKVISKEFGRCDPTCMIPIGYAEFVQIKNKS